MEAEAICIYAKFGKCKKDDCQFHHPKDICCDKTCEINFCTKKHPRYCRYFWGFDLCRNGESCRFQHSKDPNHTDDKKYEDLERKYDKLLAEYKDLKNLCRLHDNEIEKMKEQLQEQENDIYVLRGYVLQEDSQSDSVFNLTNEVTPHHDDKNYEETQMILEDVTDTEKNASDMDQEKDVDNQINSDKVSDGDHMQTSKILPKNECKSNLEYLEAEVIKIKEFVSREKMVAKGINETRQKLKSLKNEMKYKLGKSKSEKVLGNMLETLSEKVMKINHNFKKTVKSELENFAEKCRKEQIKIDNKKLTAGR